MPPTPRRIAICLILSCLTANWLCAQTAPALTPGSVFYLKERFAVKTKTGITALEPGAGVRLVSENGNALSVTDGTTTFDVAKEKLTANINEANVVAQDYYVTEQAAAEAFNAEVVRQQQEQKRALDQRAAAATQQREQEIQQQQAAERQAHIQTLPQRSASQRTAANRTNPLNLKNIHRGLDGHVMSGTATNGVNATEKRRTNREDEARRVRGENEGSRARGEAAKAENRIQELQRQAGELRERERYEYNKAASERGNQATYNVERAFEHNIQSLQGQINNAEREKADWKNRASQAEQQH
jgi:hypothetical protein